jgi:hypothetical protein
MGKPSVETRLATLEQRVAALEGGRSGRKALPIIVSEKGVCGVNPDSDSTECPHASIYRHQKGCRGTACEVAASNYYKEYRKARKADGE